MKQLSSACFLLPLLFIPAVIFPGCKNEQQQEKTEQPKTLFVFEVKNRDSVYYRDALKYEIRSPLEQDSIRFRDSIMLPVYGYVKQKAFHQRDTFITRHYPQGITLKIYSDSLKDTLALRAKKAVYSSEKGTFEFSGNVRITFGKGSIFTEQLTFTTSNGQYKTDKMTRIITADSEMVGDGFEMNETFTSYKIHNMKGVYKLPPEEAK
jgi:hypothetical protein